MVKVNSVSWGSRVLSLGYGLLLGSVFTLLPTPINAAELAEIEARGRLVVAVKDNLRPLGFKSQEGQLQGFEIDLARQLAKKILGDPSAVRLQPVSNRERLPVVMNDQVDITIAQVSQTVSRSRLVSFSPHYYIDRTAFVTKDQDVVSLDDLGTSSIAVLNQSSTIAEVRYHLPQAQLLGVNSYQEALSLLETREAVAFAGDETVLTGWIQEYPQYRLISERIGGEALAVVMPKGLQYTSLRQAVNQAIRELKASGWLQKKAEEWGLKLTINNKK